MKLELEQEDIDSLTLRITQEVIKGLLPTLLSQDQAGDTIYTVEALAKYLQTTPKWVYNHIHELPHFKKEGLIRFRKSDIDKLFEEKNLR